MASIPFKQRFGLQEPKLIDNDFPGSARVALAYLIQNLKDQGAFPEQTADNVMDEMLRTGRFLAADLALEPNTPFLQQTLDLLRKMEWWQVYTLCERIYRHVIHEYGFWSKDDWVVTRTKDEMRGYFSDQLNYILAEENIAYQFLDGQFQRQGRAQTQRAMQRVGKVLGQARLSTVRNHYIKARKFFDARPIADVENCVKEALCALEACLELLSGKPASKDFARVVQQLKGNEAQQIPPPIAEGMIKLHGYRGSGQGVAHAALEGNRVTELDAELVLSLVASYISYLVDLLTEPEETPF